MEISFNAISQLVAALAVTAGVIIGAREVRLLRREREREEALTISNPQYNELFAKAVLVLPTLPDDLDLVTLEDEYDEYLGSIAYMMLYWENVGRMVKRGQVSLEDVDEVLGGTVQLSWRKLRPLVLELRSQDPEVERVYYEWFQWLAENVREYESPPAAYARD